MLIRDFPDARIDVDLQDCDKVLRVEGTMLDASKIKESLIMKGFECAEL